MPPTTNFASEPIPEPTRRPAEHPPSNFADDDIDFDQLAAIEAQLVDNTGKRPLDSNTSNPEKKVKIETQTVNNPDDYPNDNDLICEDDEDYLREIEAQMDAEYNEPKSLPNTGPSRVSAEPFVYIKQILDLSDREKAGKVFRVKGQIMTLLSKLSVSKEEWSLKCTIVDGTGRLDVDFTSEALSKLVGVTPKEMNSMKKQMASKPELKEQVVSVSCSACIPIAVFMNQFSTLMTMISPQYKH